MSRPWPDLSALPPDIAVDIEAAAADPAIAYVPHWLELLAALPGDRLAGAELGVAAGAAAAATLAGDPRVDRHLMVDTWWPLPPGHSFLGYGDPMAAIDQAGWAWLHERALRATNFAAARREVLRMTTAEAALRVADGSLDYVFVDADHSAEGVYHDLLAWWPKARPGGLVAGHDWGRHGVADGVARFAGPRGLRIDLGPETLWVLAPHDRKES